MMKKLKTLFCLLCILQVSNAFAVTFTKPVPWQLPFNRLGGVKITNYTNHQEYVQVAVNTGRVAIYSLHAKTVQCQKEIGRRGLGDMGMICQLAPNDVLYIDLDANAVTATGSYQVAVA